MWSETFERELTDIFAIQDEISSAIASALEIQLTGKSSQATRTQNLETYDLFLEGKYYLAKRNWKNIEHSIGILEQSITLDPSFAPARASLAKAYVLLPSYNLARMSFIDGYEHTKRNLDAGMVLDPDNPDILAMYGW